MSAQVTAQPLNLKAVADNNQNSNIAAGAEILNFVDVLIDGDPDQLDGPRAELVQAAGPQAAARTALVAGNFEMMNRILDATGVPVPIRMGDITAELGLPPFTGR